jgi:hypothetical protein
MLIKLWIVLVVGATAIAYMQPEPPPPTPEQVARGARFDKYYSACQSASRVFHTSENCAQIALEAVEADGFATRAASGSRSR